MPLDGTSTRQLIFLIAQVCEGVRDTLKSLICDLSTKAASFGILLVLQIVDGTLITGDDNSLVPC